MPVVCASLSAIVRFSAIATVLLAVNVLRAAGTQPDLAPWQEEALSAALQDPLARSGSLFLVWQKGAPRSVWPVLARIIATTPMENPKDAKGNEAVARLLVRHAEDLEEASVALARSGAIEYLPTIRKRVHDLLAVPGRNQQLMLALVLFQDRDSLPAIETYLERNGAFPDEVLKAIRTWKEPRLAIAMLKHMRTNCLVGKTRSRPGEPYCSQSIGEEIQVVQEIAAEPARQFVAEAKARNPASLDDMLIRALNSPPKPKSVPESRTVAEFVARDPHLALRETLELVGNSGETQYSGIVRDAIQAELKQSKYATRLASLLVAARKLGMEVDHSEVIEAERRSGFLEPEFVRVFGPFRIEECLPVFYGLFESGSFEPLWELYLNAGVQQVLRIRPYLISNVGKNDARPLRLDVPASLSFETAPRLRQDLTSLFDATLDWAARQTPSDREQSYEQRVFESYRTRHEDPINISAMLADRLEQTVRTGERFWGSDDLLELTRIENLLKKGGYDKEASSVRRVRDDVYARSTYVKSAGGVAAIMGFWLLSWIVALTLYPHSKTVRAILFSPSVLRRIWAAGFVDAAIIRMGWVRRRLLCPFSQQLLSRAGTDPRDDASYFDEFDVEPLQRGTGQGGGLWRIMVPIEKTAILEGPSGYGKTLFLKQLSKRLTDEVICFLPAAECKEGVLEAVARFFSLEEVNTSFIGSLVREGGIVLLIDGLNEVSPISTRPKIFDLMLRYKSGRILATTQKLADDPPESLPRFRVRGLDYERASRFMERKLQVLVSDSADLDGRRMGAIRTFLAATEASSSDKENAFSHSPLDLTLAAELIAVGESPSPFGLVEQQCNRAAARLTEVGKVFRRDALAASVWTRFEAGDRTLDEEMFRLEVTAMTAEKLVFARQIILASSEAVDEAKVQTFYEFRHQQILDYFLACYLAAREDSEIVDAASEEGLRGAVLALAESQPLERCVELEKRITKQELESRHLIVAAEWRRRLGARWKRERGHDPYGPMSNASVV
jgi:hypothetical protein